MLSMRLQPLRIAAQALGVPPGWLRREAEGGRLPHLRADTAILFDVVEVERRLLERAQQTPEVTVDGR